MTETEEVLNIEQYEDKETKSGKPFVRFKTSSGWLSSFNKTSSDALKDKVGKNVKVKIKQQGDFKNIEKYIGDAGEEEDKKEKKEETKPAKPTSVKKDFLVSYAKDVFCAIVGRISQSKFDEMKDQEVINLATLSTQVVKEIDKTI